MMLFKLSLKNISKSIKDYAIYFFTLVLGVAIFYVFNAIDSQTAMLDISSRTNEIIKLMTSILSGVSVFVSFILAFLIIYASRFLIKRRNKEFAIYQTLGMGKRKISLILFFETLVIGIISLTIGLLVGFLLSQVMSIIVANMFEANLTKFTFVFSKSACGKTLIYFGIMYLVVMIFNTINISKCKLIDLIHSSKKSEKIKLKNPWVCIIIFIISVSILGYAYYYVNSGIDKMTNEFAILFPIVLGAVSTFCIFWSLSGLILKVVRKNKKFYYKELNSFTVRQISSKINTTVFSMTIICLMLFITICVLSSSLSMKNSLNKNLNNYAPRDIELTKRYNPDQEEFGYTDIQMQNSKLSIEETLTNLGFDYNKYLKDIVNFSLYADDNITLKETLGDYFETSKNQYAFLLYNKPIYLMKNSEYNNIANSFNLEKVTLSDNEYVVVGNYKDMIKIKDEALKRNTKITINDKKYYPKYEKSIHGFYEMTSNETEAGFIVVPDNAVTDEQKVEVWMVADYRGNKDEIENMINRIIQNEKFFDNIITINTKQDIKDSSVGLGAIVTFIGLYLGIIFLISCAAILALKELSESSDNFEKFNMLRRIGVDEKSLNKALFRQISVYFMFPLVLAIIHSIFGIMFCNDILKTAGVSFNLLSVIITAIFIILIYGGYFLVTYLCSKSIIKKK